MENQTWFAKLLLIGMPVALAIEGVYGILSTEGFVPLYPFLWILLRHIVLLGATSVCLFVLVRWSQRTLLTTHWYSFPGLVNYC